ncbi:LuxR C-terminal-related transcriptional regulator [Lyngbya aestuarii]|uniref:LuxR C-terminal-related transcriptional regulator n=1 Tax=Lyngbya aestuarii TaxID=118322 RepID=UPI00403E0EB3
MSSLTTNLNSPIETVEKINYLERSHEEFSSQQVKSSSLLQAIIEGFIDGVLILTSRGEWVHANYSGRQICQQISQDTCQFNSVPQPIWRVCQSLIDSRNWFPEQKMIIEDEINTDNLNSYRLRVRWLVLEESAQPYLLVTMEDKSQSSLNTALAEVDKYGLTEREADVWLLKRKNYSYKEIAHQLYITANTVKKHLKNIYAKQKEFQWSQEK